MAFADQIALAENATFRQKVRHAVTKSAIAVLAEDPETTFHSARAALAVRVLADPVGEGHRIAYGIVTNAAITDASDDAAIEFTTNSMWNAYATT